MKIKNNEIEKILNGIFAKMLPLNIHKNKQPNADCSHYKNIRQILHSKNCEMFFENPMAERESKRRVFQMKLCQRQLKPTHLSVQSESKIKIT